MAFNNAKLRKRLFRLSLNILLGLGAIVVLLPFVWMLSLAG